VSDIHEATGAYALNALSADERAEFEAHLEGCEACRREVAELRTAADALPVGVTQYSAPPALKDRLMATVRSEAELLSAAGPQADRPPARGRTQRERRGRLSWRPALALACALLVGAVAGISLTGGDDVQRLQASLAPSGAEVTMELRDEHSTLLARNLPAPPEGRIYQVWLKRRGVQAPEPTNALFTTREGAAEVDVAGDMDDVEAVLVTHEPRGGSRAPTVDPVIAITT
jgi:anti-sigma-K factor RskA